MVKTASVLLSRTSSLLRTIHHQNNTFDSQAVFYKYFFFSSINYFCLQVGPTKIKLPNGLTMNEDVFDTHNEVWGFSNASYISNLCKIHRRCRVITNNEKQGFLYSSNIYIYIVLAQIMRQA